MKITRKQLRNFILQEFRMTGHYDDFDFGVGSGGGQLPPVKPPRRGGGGGGEEPNDFSGRNNDPCGLGSVKGDMYYDKVYTTFPEWIESNMNVGDNDPYDNYLIYLSNYPNFSMDMVSENPMEFFELLMTIISVYACKQNIPTDMYNLELLYLNPIPAIVAA